MWRLKAVLVQLWSLLLAREANVLLVVGERGVAVAGQCDGAAEAVERQEQDEAALLKTELLQLQQSRLSAPGVSSMVFNDTECANGVHMLSDMEGDVTFLWNWINGLVTKGIAKNLEVRKIPRERHVWRKASDFYRSPREVLRDLDYFHFDLADGNCIVNLGDMMDSGHQSEREQGVFRGLATFLLLRERYPARVKLILGNRDINKLRLPSELRDGPYVYHTKPGPISNEEDAGPRCRNCKPRDEDHEMQDHSQSLRTRWLQWMLAKNMGAHVAFKAYLQEMQTYSVGSLSADDVTDYVLHQTKTEGGLFSEYLNHGGFVAQAGSALFVHGNLGSCIKADEDHFRAPLVEEQANLKLDLMMNGAQRAANPIDDYHGRATRAADYVDMVHHWKQQRFAEWRYDPYFARKDSVCGTSKLCRAGNAMIDMALAAPHKDHTPRNGGFSRCSPVSSAAVGPMDADTAGFLLKKGVSHLFTGHIPQGATPRSYLTPTPGGGTFTIVNMDVTYAHPVPRCQPGSMPSQRCILAVSPAVSYNPSTQESEIFGLIAAVDKNNRMDVLSYSNGVPPAAGAQEDADLSFESLTLRAFSGPGTKNKEGPDAAPGGHSGELFMNGVAPWGGYLITQAREALQDAEEGAVTSKVALWNYSQPVAGRRVAGAYGRNSRLWTTVDHKFAIRLYVDSSEAQNHQNEWIAGG
eukprot:TRINITY_DN10806_c0_g3_i1.p1 TRINITY_DN10806_c0_g3~~TRINITY_DN10806_c0_g3_i1.p1  ORF type:complete len:694 (-),score=143.67 TRINITY_DN10806_c0_g3_i1:134-2215(-)